MVGVRMELRGADAPLADLAGMIARTASPRGLFENIGLSLVASTQHRFETSTAPDGSVWPPSIRALSTGGKTLIDSARLMQSISYEASDTGVSVGSNVVYAAIHQLGGEIKQGPRTQTLRFRRGHNSGSVRFSRKGKKASFTREAEIGARTINMPARPFLGLDDDDEREIVTLADEWIAGEGARR